MTLYGPQDLIILLIILGCATYVIRSMWKAWHVTIDPSRPVHCAACTSPCKLKNIAFIKKTDCVTPVPAQKNKRKSAFYTEKACTVK
ncbi:MAG TPA: hypothetical protein PLK40_02645 [Bacteroidaceae bacterium]|nr:hypothetical protein [Bacteroidaceae bacterium]